MNIYHALRRKKPMPPKFSLKRICKNSTFYVDCYVKYNVKSEMKFQNS